MRRGKLELTERNVTEGQKKRCAYAFEYKCATCGIMLPPSWEVDHIEPLWRYGTNHDSNLQPLCGTCHNTKSQLEADERMRTVWNVHRPDEHGVVADDAPLLSFCRVCRDVVSRHFEAAHAAANHLPLGFGPSARPARRRGAATGAPSLRALADRIRAREGDVGAAWASRFAFVPEMPDEKTAAALRRRRGALR